MLNILDRYVIRSFVINYLISLTVLIGLYIIVDLFVNLDEFTERDLPPADVFVNICSYYGYNLFLYFSQLSGIITLVAASFTLARMQRSNELTAILASGTSLYRVAAPVVAMGLVLNTLWIADQEVFIPRFAHKLARPHDDVDGRETYGIWFLNDRNNALVSAVEFQPRAQKLKRVVIMNRDKDNMVTGIIMADAANWDENRQLWSLDRGILLGAKDEQNESFGRDIELGKNLVDTYESELTPKELMLRQAAQWINFMSIRQLNALEEREVSRRWHIAQVKHSRFTNPFANMILLLIGIPFFLNREPRNVLISAALSLGVCSSAFVLNFVAQNLVSTSVNPALPAWIPLLLFGPVAVVLLDRVKT
ncbi:MAG: LptF/LptG family permease [Phycisphaerae bacterium]|nr:LptF/LptG family permease [Phycisphaerae bacterium]